MSIKRVAFLGTSRSGLGHLRRLATIGKRLRALAPDIVACLITNAAPDGLSEGISAINVVKGFAREAYEEKRFAKQNNSSAEAGVVTTRLAANMDRVTQVLLALGTSVVLWYGVTRVRGGAISPGDLLVFSAYLSTLYKPIRKMTSMTARVAKATASGERLLEIFDLVPEVGERPDAIDAPGRFLGHVTFENVTFAYPDSAPVLKEAAIAFRPGEVTALVGSSGVGKSTAGRLPMRFYDPQSGCLRIDGQDIRDFTLDSLRGNISVVMQDSVLFGTSVRDNIAYGRLEATEEKKRSPPPRPPRRMGSSCPCPMAMTRCLASAAKACLAGNASGLPSPARFCAIHPF